MQNMAVVSRSPTIPMMVAMASLQACVPTVPAWIADTMYDTCTWRGGGGGGGGGGWLQQTHYMFNSATALCTVYHEKHHMRVVSPSL